MRTIFSLRILVLLGILSLVIGWRPAAPAIFLLGDSISIHYGPQLKDFLAGSADLELKQAETLQGKEFSRNGGDSRNVLAYLTAKLKEPGFRPDYLLLNCGLHDIGRDTLTKELQVPLAEYRENLETIFGLLKKKSINIIWINITPVVDSIHNSRIKIKSRYAADVEQFNQAATAVCSRHGIRIIDLFSFTRQLGVSAYMDNVHYTESTRTLQAAYITGSVKTMLNADQRQKP